MKDWLDIGASPPGEDCAQVGSNDYYPRARRECPAYINLLRRALGSETLGARLDVRSNPHDFGNYLSVVCYYDNENEGALAYAQRCESEGPENWDADARQEITSLQKGDAP